MTLEGAIKLNETADYIIYTMNSATTGQYGVVVPNNINGTLKMLVDLHMKGSFDGVGSGTKTKEQLIAEISGEYDKLKTKYTDGMLVMPMINEGTFQNAVINSDKQKMFDEVKKIGAITSELYKKLTEAGVEKQKIDQKIIIVEKNADDEKFVFWLKEQMPNFVDGVKISELGVVQEVVNPFVDNNNLFGPVQSVENNVENVASSTPVGGGGIFDNIAPVAPASPVEPVFPSAPVEPVTPLVSTNSVFPEPVSPSTPVEPVVNSVPVSNVDIFGIPTDVQGINPNTNVGTTNVASAPVENTVTPNAVVSENPAPVAQPVVEGPKPVESSMLEGTIAFTPIPNHPNNPSENVESNEGDGGNSVDKRSKGFANLLILLVILVGVTLVSIELGKFLYNVYGA